MPGKNIQLALLPSGTLYRLVPCLKDGRPWTVFDGSMARTFCVQALEGANERTDRRRVIQTPPFLNFAVTGGNEAILI